MQKFPISFKALTENLGIKFHLVSGKKQLFNLLLVTNTNTEEFHAHLKKHPEYYSLISISKQKTAEEKKLD